MKTIQIFLNDLAATSQVTCPYCQRSRSIPNTQLQSLRHALRAKCSCENVFELVVNRRCFPRKDVRFEGELSLQGASERLAEIVVTSLSVGGVGFLVEGLAPQVGDIFTIAFSLDDDVKTEVREDIIVRNLRGEVTGAEFIGHGTYNFDLDFYLMPFDPDLKDEDT
ncbi:MAG: hypothetical protein ETSY1_41015 [Candidatus Entotheonella factor]|uniref:PilZ domain-containing protein n=1 Tax=Entotheonella factor TaxID=1429438 RepID=W4L4K0_ENTF1|nr:MAG: hypothetical protein ETSY1_41015 [Candidatus Entotheonella factor]